SAARLRSAASHPAVVWAVHRASVRAFAAGAFARVASEAAVPAPAFADKYSVVLSRSVEEQSLGQAVHLGVAQVAAGSLCQARFPERAFRALRPGPGAV